MSKIIPRNLKSLRKLSQDSGLSGTPEIILVCSECESPFLVTTFREEENFVSLHCRMCDLPAFYLEIAPGAPQLAIVK